MACLLHSAASMAAMLVLPPVVLVVAVAAPSGSALPFFAAVVAIRLLPALFSQALPLPSLAVFLLSPFAGAFPLACLLFPAAAGFPCGCPLFFPCLLIYLNVLTNSVLHFFSSPPLAVHLFSS